MKLLLALAFTVVVSVVEPHYVYLPLEGYDQFQPVYHYVLQHPSPVPPPTVPQRPTRPVRPPLPDISRETLEDQDDFQQHIPDISVEQSEIDPDDSQGLIPPQRPVPRPYPQPRPKVPSLPVPRPALRPTVPSGFQPPSPPRPHPGPRQEPEIPQLPQVPDVPQLPLPDDDQQHQIPQPDNEEPSGHGGMPYSYNYNTDLHSKTETADDNGNVEGSYTYVDGAGVTRTVTYTVKGDEGFIASGDIHPDPGSNDVGSPTTSTSPPLKRPTNPTRPTAKGKPSIPLPRPPVKGHPSPKGDEEPSGHGGMPYSYNYNTDLHSKTETADDNGNVEGSYTYVDGAGVTRTVTYTVKGDSGFVATGDIYPDPGSDSNTGVAPPAPPSRPLPAPPGPRPSVGGKGVPSKPPGGVKGTKKGSGWDKYPLGK